MGKDIQTLTAAMDKFVTSKGWYQSGSRRPQTPGNIAKSLVLESAEVLEHFQWQENDFNKENLASELADVALYLFQLARICDIDLEKAILIKLDENYHRQWDMK